MQRLDYLVAARGNGTTIVGPGPVLKAKWPDMKTVLFEEAGKEGKAPTALFGTAGGRVTFPFRQDPRYGFRNFMDETVSINETQLPEILDLAPRLGLNVGNTSLAALWVAKQKAVQAPDSTIMLTFYDVGTKYGRELKPASGAKWEAELK